MLVEKLKTTDYIGASTVHNVKLRQSNSYCSDIFIQFSDSFSLKNQGYRFTPCRRLSSAVDSIGPGGPCVPNFVSSNRKENRNRLI